MILSENRCSLPFPVSDRKSRWSNDGWHCQ